jgi:hypothetical protein
MPGIKQVRTRQKKVLKSFKKIVDKVLPIEDTARTMKTITI